MDQRDLFRAGARSLAARALLALLLMLGFYLLAFGMSGLLVYLPYAELVYLHRVHPKLVLLCLAGAGLILWSILPRFERFTAPGPLLARGAQPKLFGVIDQVAAAAAQAPPSEVYLLHDMNAWVSSRGGWMGFGSRRTMGIGLPLLEQLNVSQLRGVLAHEFGHYHGGDVKLGPWIYKTRSAMQRTIVTLARAGSALLHKPFLWYGQLFLRLTHAVSRHQELEADALAAHIVGREAFVSGMKAVHAGGHAFQSYWHSEVAPVLSAGYRPPLARGYAQYLGSHSCEKLHAIAAESLQGEEADPYDTHPPTRERIARVEAMQGLPAALPLDERSSMELLEGVDQLEQELLRCVAADPELTAKLLPISWERVGEAVWLKSWKGAEQSAAAQLSQLTPASVPTSEKELQALGQQLLGKEASEVPERFWALHAARVIAAATACRLVERGWALEALPGEQVVFRSPGAELKPFSVLADLAAGTGSASAWVELHKAAGISQQPLSACSPAADAQGSGASV